MRHLTTVFRGTPCSTDRTVVRPVAMPRAFVKRKRAGQASWRAEHFRGQQSRPCRADPTRSCDRVELSFGPNSPEGLFPGHHARHPQGLEDERDRCPQMDPMAGCRTTRCMAAPTDGQGWLLGAGGRNDRGRCSRIRAMTARRITVVDFIRFSVRGDCPYGGRASFPARNAIRFPDFVGGASARRLPPNDSAQSSGCRGLRAKKKNIGVKIPD